MSKLAEVLESRRIAANRAPAVTKPALTGFVKPGSTHSPLPRRGAAPSHREIVADEGRPQKATGIHERDTNNYCPT